MNPNFKLSSEKDGFDRPLIKKCEDSIEKQKVPEKLNCNYSKYCFNKNCPFDHPLKRKYDEDSERVKNTEIMLRDYFTYMIENSKENEHVNNFFVNILNGLEFVDYQKNHLHKIYYDIICDVFVESRKNGFFKRLLNKFHNFDEKDNLKLRNDNLNLRNEIREFQYRHNFNNGFIYMGGVIDVFYITRIDSNHYQLVVDLCDLMGWHRKFFKF